MDKLVKLGFSDKRCRRSYCSQVPPADGYAELLPDGDLTAADSSRHNISIYFHLSGTFILYMKTTSKSLMPYHSNPEKIASDTIISLWSDLHHKKQQLWLPVLSGSMLPLLRIGDRVLVESVSPENIKFGDIIVFKDLDKLVVHRVIQKYNDGNKSFLQKGDNARIAEIVMSENIIGRVTAVQRGTKVISLNFWIWKTYNYILTFISWSSYSHKPENLVLRKIAKLFYKIIKMLLKWM